jgi:DNA (cytosine-5)-methyltransferase 1
MSVYYNEIDPKAAAWLRELIKGGHIAAGDVDERSIVDVQPGDLVGYTQCHFFAGIGGWSYALRLAGWPDDRPVWTGSCPCQPFSAAGKRGGMADARHLWPQFYRLIKKRRPSVVFGEQVASKDGLVWLDLVYTDMETANYAFTAVDLCAASVGAPHIRQRLYFVADSNGSRFRTRRAGKASDGRNATRIEPSRFRDASGLGQPDGRGRPSGQSSAEAARYGRSVESTSSRVVGVAHDPGPRERRDGANQRATWEAELVNCRDGKRRPVEPGTFPLAHGVSGRVGLLRGYGNAIVPQVAAEFIGAYLDISDDNL